ncbi:DUF4139 domain-containing protein [candidate division TA06 bacterium]|uniref:DUF4139 domain-containing protein n=1 Tax=candidate division TA06 bacterium TaxID=2250710 RepID=A0A933IC35_UNCT6|nr:DUF4139 domain-containing protein [candidate division TA06 bacterium]
MKQITQIILPALVLAAAVAAGQNDREISLTVYNNNLGLVSEVRQLSLKKGASEVRITDVPSQIDPTSVFFQSLSDPDKFTVLEQNYQYDLVSSAKLLERYLDQNIKAFGSGGKVYEGTLLSYDGSNIVLSTGGSITTLRLTDNLQNFEFPSLPQGLITRPTLLWLVDNQGPASQKCRISYLTAGISWHAEYVAVLAADEKTVDLGAWVSLENNSGTGFQQARLKLVAGEVNRAQAPQRRYAAAKADFQAAPAQFEEESFFEYHLYTLQRKATVANNEVKQISLFPNTRADCKKLFIYDGASSGKKVTVQLEFRNEKASGLGMPLPAGKIRVYKKDDGQSQQFIGEDRIDHTPKDEKVRITLGSAFDIVGERTPKEYKRINDKTQEQTVEVKLRNHKNEGVEVTVVEHLSGDWEIKSKTHEFKKRDAQAVEFKVPVARDGETVLSYTVRYKW